MRLEAPIDVRLKELVNLVKAKGHRLDGCELVAALILTAEEDADALMERVLRYRTATVADASVAGAQVVELAERRRGRMGRGPS
jgi:hypothetical protein